jgi:hypothetical protein
MAEVPESVNRSIYTYWLGRRKVLKPASAMARSRSSRVVMRRCSTILTFQGSAQERWRGMDGIPFVRPNGWW